MIRSAQPLHPSTPPPPVSLNRVSRPVLVLRLRGSQAEMGAQHGRLLRHHGGWEPAVAYYPGLPQRLLGGGDARGLRERLARVFGEALIEWALRRIEQDRPAEYLARTRAFGEGLGIGSEMTRYLGIMDVFQNFVGLAGRWRIGPFSRRARAAALPACSTVMVWGAASRDGALRHARNFDLPGIGVWDSAPSVVFCEPDSGVRYGFVTTRGADTPGVTAFNEAGLTLTMHTRFHRDVRFSGAAVVDLGHDIIRRAETLRDAVTIARERSVASTWGVAISSAREGRGLTIETNGRQAVVVQPRAGDDHLGVTNRYRHPLTQAGEVDAGAAWAEHSDGREARIRAVVEARGAEGGMSATDLERLLGDNEDPSVPGQERAGGSIVAQPITVQSVVSEPERRTIRVASATVPTSWGPYTEVEWTWDGAVGATEASPAEGCVTPEPDSIELLRAGRRFRGGDAARAYAHWVEANRIEAATHDLAAALVEVEHAIAADPTEPTYRFVAGAARLKQGDYSNAVAQLAAGLQTERAPFRRGQLLLWGSRAADAGGLREQASAWRRELLELRHPHLEGHHHAARREERWTFPRRKLASLSVSFELLDILY